MKDIEELLTNTAGLFDNRRQAAIYLALLKIGSSGIENLHTETGVHRETIQREVKKMHRIGTVAIQRLGRNKKIEATPPSQLQEILEATKERFDFILKPLLEVSAEQQHPKINVFLGHHHLGLLQLRLLKLQPPKQNICVISTHPKDWREAMVASGKLEQFERLRIKNDVGFLLSCFSKYRGEVEHNNREFFTTQPPALKRKYRYVESTDSTPLQIQVWENHVVISIFSAKPSIHIVFEDKNIRNAMKSYFDILWRIGTV